MTVSNRIAQALKISVYTVLLCLSTGSALSIAQSQSTQTEDDEIAEQMITLIKEISEQRYPDAPIKRFNQPKSLGCFQGDFHVEADLPVQLKKGLFAQSGPHPAHVRFANASTENDSKKDLRGMSIKVLEVQGTALWGKSGEQDFVLNSYPALFAETPEDFLKFIRATKADRRWWYFFNPLDWHIGAFILLMKARKHHSSPFDIRYWSTTPFQLGNDGDVVVKYSTQPCSSYNSNLPEKLTENYLSEAMQNHLKNAPACFEFMVQLQTDADSMPIEDASVIWNEKVSPFIKVATLIIDDQDFLDEEVMRQCEYQAFHPWQSLPEHRPLGRMNYVRNRVYGEIIEYRHQTNEMR